MAFALETPTKVTITKANPRSEFHGEEKVRAIDLAFSLKGENTLLDQIQEGLREHHFCNRAAEAQQQALPDVVIPLPNIRHPNLPTAYHYQKGVKLRGYRFVWDYGMSDDHVDFQDVVLSNLQYEIFEGGTVAVSGTIQYNGEELQDNILYGELSGLASDGEIHIKLIPPAVLQIAKKGYRAGKPDTQPGPDKNPDQGDLDIDDQQSPEDAFAAAAMGKVWIRGADDESHDSIDSLLSASHEQVALDVGEEVDIETESGLLVVVRITDIDDAGNVSHEIVTEQPLEDAPE